MSIVAPVLTAGTHPEQTAEPAEPAEPNATTSAPASADPTIAVTPPTSADPASTEPADDIHWSVKRLSEVTRQRREAEAKAAKLEAELAELRAKVTQQTEPASSSVTSPPSPSSTGPTPAEIDALVARRAHAMQMANQVAEINNQGMKQFKDWNNAVQQLDVAVGGITSTPQGLEVLRAAMGSSSPHQVLHHLGMNPAKAEAISQMDPARMAVELYKLGEHLKAPPVSSIAAPVTPISAPSTAAPQGLEGEMSDDEWMRRRIAQLEG